MGSGGSVPPRIKAWRSASSAAACDRVGARIEVRAAAPCPGEAKADWFGAPCQASRETGAQGPLSSFLAAGLSNRRMPPPKLDLIGRKRGRSCRVAPDGSFYTSQEASPR
mmetsp:Transcript_125544/g.360922  ORF Transcript_125544/g.360922 Transcript_125544/m.360922 type:complete len:110 (-) Transcript_125544:265-594(-)